MQYVGVGLLAGGASLITVILTTVTVNARHLFYSISMTERYRDAGKARPYLIFALTDETYSLLCDGRTPEGTDPDRYRLFVSLFDQCYWVTGSVLGTIGITADERVCSGAHYARFFADMKNYLLHPELLEQPPEKVRFDPGCEYHVPKINPRQG